MESGGTENASDGETSLARKRDESVKTMVRNGNFHVHVTRRTSEKIPVVGHEGDGCIDTQSESTVNSSIVPIVCPPKASGENSRE